MAKRLEELKSGIQESFKDGYESEKMITEMPPIIQELEIRNEEIVQKSKEVIEEKTKGLKDTKKKKVKTESTETKTRRFPLLIRPSLYEDIEKIAYINVLSVNEQINRCLEEFQLKEKDKIKKYNEFMK